MSTHAPAFSAPNLTPSPAIHGRLAVFLIIPGAGDAMSTLRREAEGRCKGEIVDARPNFSGLPDLATVLARSPAAVLVDDLARANPPGARHAWRWQDAVEFLEAGIDVFALLDPGAVASRADAVAAITGRRPAEAVPDPFLEHADTIGFIEAEPIAPSLNESQRVALRALALRLAAEHVEHRLATLRRNGRNPGWRSTERLMVAVGPSPFSTQLIRWTRRTAAALGAPWIGVHVEMSRPFSAEVQSLIENNLALVRELGGEMVLTRDDDVAAALVRVAQDHEATQIIIGKPSDRRWHDRLRGRTMVERLFELGGKIDIHMIPAASASAAGPRLRLEGTSPSGWGEYALVIASLAGITATGLLAPESYYLSVGLVYLLTIILLSLRVGRWPMLLAGVLSALTWEYVFIPPKFAIAIANLQDALLFGTYFAVALVAGQLTARIRSHAHNERLREERATALFRLTYSLTEAATLDDAVQSALGQMDRLFAAQTALALPSTEDGPLVLHAASAFGFDPAEREAAEWACQHQRPAGRFSSTLASCGGYYEPLVREGRSVGVLGVKIPADRTLPAAQRELIEAFARQLALIVEREQLRRAGEREKLLAESDRLHRALLDSVSHELRTPLSIIASAAEDLEEIQPEARSRLLGEIRIAALRLNRVVENLLDQTRLESGALRPRAQWGGADELLQAAIQSVRDALVGRSVDIHVPADMPPVHVDWTLTVHALACLLLNAASHTPAGTPVSLSAEYDETARHLLLRVADRGPGVPAAIRGRLFQKFVRGDPARAGGVGLGLSIVKGFSVAQGGEVSMNDNPGGGTVFTICLPQPPRQDGPAL
jgi:two-component system sensor histidine kinase KdpD